MNKLWLTIRLLKTLVEINKFNTVHSSYHRQSKKIIKEITALHNFNSTSNFLSKAKPKMQWYMAEFIYTCERLNYLLGNRSTVEQRKMYLLSGLLGAMCDMIIDDVEMSTDRIKLLKRPSPSFKPMDMVEELYVTCYNSFVLSLKEDTKQRTIEYYELLFDAQVRSKKQFDKNINQKEVDDICKQKGGLSMLFLRSMINGEITAVEKNAWFELGGFVQYCNDAQDLYKDLNKNVRTFASTRSDLEIIANDLDTQKAIAFSLIKNTSFQLERKDNFLFTLHVMSIAIRSKLHAFSRICNCNFSFEKLQSKSKKEIRLALKAVFLLRYGFPKVISYQYKNVEKPYPPTKLWQVERNHNKK